MGLGTLLPWNFFMTATMVGCWDVSVGGHPLLWWSSFEGRGVFEARIPSREYLFGQDTSGILSDFPPFQLAVIFFLLQYFTSRLKDPSTGAANQTLNGTAGDQDTRSLLESKFNNVMTLCAMVPLLIFTCLNSFIHQR